MLRLAVVLSSRKFLKSPFVHRLRLLSGALVSILPLLAGGALTACKKDAPSPKPSTSSTFDLLYKQPAAVAAGAPVQATLVAVNDARCPSNVQCIWAGYVAVAVELTDDTATQTARIALGYKYLPAYSADSVAVVLNKQPYWLRLLAVGPYPAYPANGQAQTATLRLRPR